MATDPKHPYGPPNVMTAAEVFTLAKNAGFSALPPVVHGPSPPGGNYSDASIAVAIASAESGLDASIVNPANSPTNHTSTPAVGLWQIHPGTRALINPEVNAIAAHAKFLAQGWQAWTMYTNGTYKRYLGSVTSQPGAVASAGVIDLPNPLHGIEAIGSFFASLTQGSTWLRVLFVLIGVGLGAWALFALASETKVGKAAIGAATKAVAA